MRQRYTSVPFVPPSSDVSWRFPLFSIVESEAFSNGAECASHRSLGLARLAVLVRIRPLRGVPRSKQGVGGQLNPLREGCKWFRTRTSTRCENRCSSAPHASCQLGAGYGTKPLSVIRVQAQPKSRHVPFMAVLAPLAGAGGECEGWKGVGSTPLTRDWDDGMLGHWDRNQW